MVPLTHNGVLGFSHAPVTEGRLGGQDRPTVMIPLSSSRVLPTSAGIPMNSDESWTTVMGRRLPTSRQLIPPVRRTRNQRRAVANRGRDTTEVSNHVDAISSADFNGPSRPFTGSGATGRGATLISGSGGVIPRSGTVPVLSRTVNGNSPATRPTQSDVEPLKETETVIRVPTRRSEPPEVAVGRLSPVPEVKPSVSSTHSQRIVPKVNAWLSVGPGGRRLNTSPSIHVQTVNDDEMVLLCSQSAKFVVAGQRNPEHYFKAVYPQARGAYEKFLTGLVTIEAWASLPSVISGYYDTKRSWDFFANPSHVDVELCHALLQSMLQRRNEELQAWLGAYPVPHSGSSSGSDGEGGGRRGGLQSPLTTVGTGSASTASTTNTSRGGRAGATVSPTLLGGAMSRGAPVLLSELDHLRSGGATHSVSKEVVVTGSVASVGVTPVGLSGPFSAVKGHDVRSGGVTPSVTPSPPVIPVVSSVCTPDTQVNDGRSGGGTPKSSISMKDVLLAHLQTITDMLLNPPSASMIKDSSGREALALARSTTMVPTGLGGRSEQTREVLHPKLTTNGRPMTATEVHSKMSAPDMTADEVQNILTAWTENEAILRRRGGESRDWRDPKLFDPYKEERSFVTLVPDRKPHDPYKGFNDVHRDSSNTAGLLRVPTNQAGGPRPVFSGGRWGRSTFRTRVM